MESIHSHFVISETPYKLGISGDCVQCDEQANITIELMIDEIDSTLDNTNLFLELVVVEDKIPDAYDNGRWQISLQEVNFINKLSVMNKEKINEIVV